jgi:hypothetical protein
MENEQGGSMANESGLFLVQWLVGNEMPGAPILQIHGGVYPPGRKITGVAHLTQATNPPLDYEFEVTGSYIIAAFMGGSRNIVTLNSVNHGRVGEPSLEALLVINEDWKSGTGNFKYWIGSTFNEIRDVPVRWLD